MTVKCVRGEHSECSGDDCRCLCHVPGEEFHESTRTRTRREVLSPKESKIAALVGEGFRVAEIADEFTTSEQTVKNVLKNIYRKVGLQNDGRICLQVRLGVWWNCELFQRGLSA